MSVNRDEQDGDRAGSPPPRRASVPRWVQVIAGVAVVIVALVLIMLALGHNPGQHLGASTSAMLVVAPR